MINSLIVLGLMPIISLSSQILRLTRSCFPLVAALLLPVTVYAEIELNLKTNSAFNTYVNDQPIVIEVDHPSSAHKEVQYYWQSYDGHRLSEPKFLDESGRTVIELEPGDLPHYVGLVFRPVNARIALAGREPGEKDEYGFAVFSAPPAKKILNANQWIGVVHPNFEDAWLGGWSKSMTWKTTSAKWWGFELEKRREAGFIELPIITGSEWKTDDEEKIGVEQLSRLKSRARDFISADSETLYWETGIEENLGGGFDKEFYFNNLVAKSNVIRAVADEVNPNIKLLFQIANMRIQDVGVFMRSGAAKNYDVLSLHPYNWPDFPSPEDWLKEFLADVREQMEPSGRVLPIWLTEIGAPHEGNSPGNFFGYPKKKKEVRGLSRQEMASYLAKFHVMSYHEGVERVFWYNYKDRGAHRNYAEDHFGLIDYWGNPKPAYSAYVHLYESLADKKAGEALQKDDIWAYEFKGDAESVIVAWLHPASSRELDISQLGIESSDNQVIRITNVIGDDRPFHGNKVQLDSEPVYIFLESK